MKYYIENPSQKDFYVFDFIFHTLGIKGELVKATAEAVLVYGNIEDPISSEQISIPRRPLDVIWNELVEQGINDLVYHGPLDFDLVNAIGYFLTDGVNRQLTKDSYDAHNRLYYESSYQFKNGIADFPIVNNYLLFLKKIFLDKFNVQSKPLYPPGKKACIILSHDVDGPGKYDHFFNFPIDYTNPKTAFNSSIQWLKLLKQYVKDKHRNQYWVFDELLELESNYGFKSTSFFAATNLFNKYGHAIDVPYSLKQSKYVKIMTKMIDMGFEVALHAGYNAYESLDNFKREKKTLEEIINRKVLGLRHHYWHLGKDPYLTMNKHEAAEFGYDSSLAFNDHLGFRYNVGFPFYPFDLKSNKMIKVLQIPTVCMDGNLFYKEGMTVEHAISDLKDHINVIKDHEGVGSIDWHIRTSIPTLGRYNAWGQAYSELLKILKNDDEIWVTSFEEFYNWWSQRSAADN